MDEAAEVNSALQSQLDTAIKRAESAETLLADNANATSIEGCQTGSQPEGLPSEKTVLDLKSENVDLKDEILALNKEKEGLKTAIADLKHLSVELKRKLEDSLIQQTLITDDWEASP